MSDLKAADLQAPPAIASLQTKALGIGLVGVAASIAGYIADPVAFTGSYLLAFVYWISIPLGSLAFLMIHHLSGGGWGMPARRIFEAAARTLPFMAILGLPVLLGMHHIYSWTDAAKVAADPILQMKAPYLNIPFFLARYVFYFLIWTGLSYTLSGWSRTQDTSYEPGSERKFRLLSGPGILIHAIISTFAAVDWMMSLDPHWFSTIFGLLFLSQQGLASLGFLLLVMARLSKTAPLSRHVKPENIHDYGKLLLAFVMIWAYFSFSQFLIIWSANLPEEVPWYLHRLHGGWQAVALGLIVFHFALPFLLLLSRDLKTHARRLAIVAALILAARFLDLLWLIAPNFPEGQHGVHVSWMDFAAPVAIGGLWMAGFVWQLKQRPLLPLHDPLLAEVLEHQHAGH